MKKTVTTGKRQFQIVASTYEQIQEKLQGIISQGLHLCSISYIRQEYEYYLFVLTRPVRRCRYTCVDSVKREKLNIRHMPLTREELPAVQEDSTVIYRCLFRIPLDLSHYLEIQLSGRRRDPGMFDSQ